jgi:hypothetical protein
MHNLGLRDSNEGGMTMYLLKTDSWYLERIIFLMAGILVLASSILAWVHSIYWLILTLLVGLNLLILAATGFCPSAILFDKMGVKSRLGQTGK